MIFNLKKMGAKSRDPRADAGFLSALLDSLPTPVYAKDEEGRFIYSNTAHDERIGASGPALLGKTDTDFHSPELAAKYREHERNVLSTGEAFIGEEWPYAANGKAVPVLTRKARMPRAGGGAAVVGVNFDLAEIKRREEQNRILARMVTVGVGQLEDDGRVSYTNPVFRNLFSGDKNLTLARVSEGLKAPLSFPEKAQAFETQINAGGEVHDVMVNCSGWLALPGATSRSAIITLFDITENAELKRINAEVSRLNTELAASMKELQQAQEALLAKGRMEQMGQLTATIAHELRNPMGAIRTSAFLLERKLKDQNLGVETQLQRINNGITRCDSIITQLLDFSRTKKLVAEAGDLDQWLASTLEDEAANLASCITLQCDLGLDGKLVPFDRTRLHRAVSNLLRNAAEAMVGTGDTPLPGVDPQPSITVSTALKDGMVEVAVTDNGPGMAPDILTRIREPLFTTKSFGTGLGVPAVEQIALQHGGTLEISSQPGQGARFAVRIPAKPSKETEAA